MEDKMILLVEDNADDEALALCALEKNNIGNAIVVARVGAEALDFLFCSGAYVTRGDPYFIQRGTRRGQQLSYRRQLLRP